jgi:hypothetical protein
MAAIDPRLQRRAPRVTRQTARTQTRESSDSSSETSSSESSVDFYQFKGLSVEHVCPFADPSRQNPCEDYAQPCKRKDAIMKHLLKMQADPDDHHPASDALWNAPLTKYMMSKRPTRYGQNKRKRGSQAAARRYYEKRVKTQGEKADELKEKYDRGEISVEEYKKVLVGNRRREFLAEQRLKGRLEQQITADNERRLQQQLDGRLQELRQSGASSDDTARIHDLEAIRDKLTQTERSVQNHRQQIAAQSARVVEFFSAPGFLDSESSFLQHHSFSWPSSVSVDAFYSMAVVLLPQKEWNMQIRSGHCMRAMKAALSAHLKVEKEGVDEEDYHYLDQILSIFNSSCDLVLQEESRAGQQDTAKAQEWLDEQEQKWAAAQKKFGEMFKFYEHPPIEQTRLIGEYAEMYRELKQSEEDAQGARENAQQAAGA